MAMASTLISSGSAFSVHWGSIIRICNSRLGASRHSCDEKTGETPIRCEASGRALKTMLLLAVCHVTLAVLSDLHMGMCEWQYTGLITLS